jgi:hypothetical protein
MNSCSGASGQTQIQAFSLRHHAITDLCADDDVAIVQHRQHVSSPWPSRWKTQMLSKSRLKLLGDKKTGSGFRDVADYFSNPRLLTAYWDIREAQPSWGKVG